MDNNSHEQTHGNIVDSLSGVRQRQSWRPAAMSAANSFVSDIKNDAYPFINKTIQLSQWYESFSHRVRPWHGFLAPSLEFPADEKQNEVIKPLYIDQASEKNISSLQPLIRQSYPYPAFELAILKTSPDTASRYKESDSIIKNPENNILQKFNDFLPDSMSNRTSNFSNPIPYEFRINKNVESSPRIEMQTFPINQDYSVSKAQIPDPGESPVVRWKAMDAITTTIGSNDVQDLKSGKMETDEKSLNHDIRIPVGNLRDGNEIKHDGTKYSRISESMDVHFKYESNDSEDYHSKPDNIGLVEKLIEYTRVPRIIPGIEMRILPEKNSTKRIEKESESKRPKDEVSIRTRTQESENPIDINAVAEKVYLNLMRRQQLEKERRGLY